MSFYAVAQAAETSGWSAAAIAAVIAALVSAAFSLTSLWINGVRQERSRRQQLYADALAVITAYKEFAYAIRRRRAPLPDKPEIAGAERVRLSEALREVQRELAYFEAWLRGDAHSELAAAYLTLASETRKIAGRYMRDAWNAPPLDNDPGMNIPDIDFSGLGPFETAYIREVAKALEFWRMALPSKRSSAPHK